jgi:catechol 2,3-dioxygenase-like lactoylglutathione lyase family enzyme
MKLDHVALNVNSISKAIEWYAKTCDATVLYEDSTWGLVSVGEAKIAFTLHEDHPAHIAFSVDSLSDFPSDCEPKQHRDGSTYFYKSDPWGNIIEFIKY